MYGWMCVRGHGAGVLVQGEGGINLGKRRGVDDKKAKFIMRHTLSPLLPCLIFFHTLFSLFWFLKRLNGGVVRECVCWQPAMPKRRPDSLVHDLQTEPTREEKKRCGMG